MKCGHCDTLIPGDAKFCHACGSQVSDAEGQAAATAEMDEASFVHMEELLRTEVEGEFEIERRLGKGGMAIVYLATEVHLSRKVAIKVLPPELTFGHGVERFKREAKTAAALDHPNIIPIYRVATGGKLFWYAMKFLEGKSLDELLREKERFTLEETVDILDQVAEALDYAHDHQVIHRDIKPANVMLDSRNRVTVTDYGIAKALTEGTLTASGSVVGTPYYMSPEQGMGRPVTGAADQYSVAVMAYRMLSGNVPFEGESAVEILHKHCMVPAPPLSTVMGGLPDHVYFAVHKALEKKPENRFSSCRAFVDALRKPTAELETMGDAATVQVSAEEVSRITTGAGPDVSSFETTPMPSAADFSGETVKMGATPSPEGLGAITPATPTPAPSIIAGVPTQKKSKRWMVFATLGLISIGGGAGAMWWLSQAGGATSGGETPEDTTAALTTIAGQGSQTPGAAASQDSSERETQDSATTTLATVDTQPTEPVREPEPTPTQTRTTPPARDPTPPVREQPPAPTTGGIVITNLPSGATVLLDNRVYRGDASAISGLSPGSHRVTVRAEGREVFDVSVRVSAGVDSRLPYTARWLAFLWVRIRPAGVDELQVGGRTVARDAREFRDTLVAGEPVTMSFIKAGFARLDTTITLNRGDNEIRIGLRRN
jgi:serine/threonine-protein kinase